MNATDAVAMKHIAPKTPMTMPPVAETIGHCSKTKSFCAPLVFAIATVDVIVEDDVVEEDGDEDEFMVEPMVIAHGRVEVDNFAHGVQSHCSGT